MQFLHTSVEFDVSITRSSVLEICLTISSSPMRGISRTKHSHLVGSHSSSGKLSSWASIRRPRRSNVAANCAAWIDIVSPFMECNRGQACARLSPVPAIWLHADSIQHATSVQVRSAYRLLCFGQREEPGES